MQSSGTPPSTQHHWLPPDFPVQPLWQRFQLRRHLSELSQHLSLLKAVWVTLLNLFIIQTESYAAFFPRISVWLHVFWGRILLELVHRYTCVLQPFFFLYWETCLLDLQFLEFRVLCLSSWLWAVGVCSGEELQALQTLKHSASTASNYPESCATESASSVSQIGELSVDFHRTSTHAAVHARPTLESPTEKSEEALNESNGSLMETEMQSSNQLSQTIDIQEPFTSDRCTRFLTAIREGGSNELWAREAAAGLQQKVQGLLEPLQAALSGQGGWENAAAAAQLANKQLKIQRNRRWRQRKRQKIGEALHKVHFFQSEYSCISLSLGCWIDCLWAVWAYSTLVLLITEFCSFPLHLQEHEGYEEADRKADEWRAREIAKLIAKRKVILPSGEFCPWNRSFCMCKMFLAKSHRETNFCSSCS